MGTELDPRMSARPSASGSRATRARPTVPTTVRVGTHVHTFVGDPRPRPGGRLSHFESPTAGPRRERRRAPWGLGPSPGRDPGCGTREVPVCKPWPLTCRYRPDPKRRRKRHRRRPPFSFSTDPGRSSRTVLPVPSPALRPVVDVTPLPRPRTPSDVRSPHPQGLLDPVRTWTEEGEGVELESRRTPTLGPPRSYTGRTGK